MDNEYIIIYNTLSRALVKIKQKDYSLDNVTLIKNGFVIDDSVNEFQKYQYWYYNTLFSNKSKTIYIATTMDCNLRCPYCFEEGNKSKEYITEDVLQAVRKYINYHSNTTITIVWFGGEPFLKFDAIIALSNELDSDKIQFKSEVITNGTILTNQMLKLIDCIKLKKIQITIDGTKEVHNLKRFFKDKSGTFDIIILNISRILKNTNTSVIVKINLDRINANCYMSITDYLKTEFNEYLENGRLHITEGLVLNRTNFSDHKDCLSKDEYFDFLHNKLQKPCELPKISEPCDLRRKDTIIIGPDGSIYKCLEQLGDKNKAIGNIKEFKTSVQKQAEYALGNSPFYDTECIDCKILPICGGGCPLDRERYNDTKEEHLCDVAKKRLHEIISRYYEQNFKPKD